MKVKCLDCPTLIERRESGAGAHRRRCAPCRKERERLLKRSATAKVYRARRILALCVACGDPCCADSKMYCEEHLRRHAARQAPAMRAKRAADPVYRELERYAVRKRMRKRRAALRALGLSNEGTPYTSEDKRNEARDKSARMLGEERAP